MQEEKPKEKLWNRDYIKVWIANFMIFFFFHVIDAVASYLSARSVRR